MAKKQQNQQNQKVLVFEAPFYESTSKFIKIFEGAEVV